MCQLEASGKWPDKLDAVAEIKTAFVIHISRLLRDQCHLVTAPSRQYLDVLKVLPHHALSTIVCCSPP